MKSITLKIITARRGDYVPPRAGDSSVSPAEENLILDSVERIVPESPDPDGEDVMELTTAALMDFDADGRCTIRYKESELSGMEGSVTSVSYRKSEPSLISMLRDGSVKTALVFEPGARHLCVYQTPIMPFEVCVYTRSVKNDIEAKGLLEMDYTVELRGAQAEHTAFSMRVLPVFDKPISK